MRRTSSLRLLIVVVIGRSGSAIRQLAWIGLDGDWLGQGLAVDRKPNCVFARLQTLKTAAGTCRRGIRLSRGRSRRMAGVHGRRQRTAAVSHAHATRSSNVEREAV